MLLMKSFGILFFFGELKMKFAQLHESFITSFWTVWRKTNVVLHLRLHGGALRYLRLEHDLEHRICNVIGVSHEFRLPIRDEAVQVVGVIRIDATVVEILICLDGSICVTHFRRIQNLPKKLTSSNTRVVLAVLLLQQVEVT